MAQISVIVPVYQVEAYLPQCIDSILAQTFRDFELILVDDGSKDQSGEICDEYAAKDRRICVIHQANQGPGAARNHGVAAACGTYILFLDSDDMLDGNDALRILVDCADASQADITVGNYRRFSAKGVEVVCAHGFSNGVDSRTPAFRYQGFYLNGHLAFNWGKLYRKSFLQENRLIFRNYQLAEDKLYNICCYACCPCYAFTEQSVVLYRRTENSLTRQASPDFIKNWIHLIEAFSGFLVENGMPEDYYDVIAFHYFYGSFFIVEQGLRHGDDFRAIVRRIREYGQYDTVRKAMCALARGKYISAIPSLLRRVITWGASAAFSVHAYWLFAASTGLFVKAQYQNE